jgi:uncharacterized repeat protein (TIGR01451 family)
MPSFDHLCGFSLHLVLGQSKKYILTNYFRPKHPLFWRLKALLFAGAALLLLEILLPQKATAASCSINTITRISSPGKFYIDSGVSPSPLGMYVGYKITNNSGAAYSDLWVKLENFTGGIIGLGTNEDGIVHVGYLASGDTTTVYVYLKATGAPSNTTSAVQKHTVSLYPSRPNLTTATCGDEFSLVTEQTIQANSNKVDGVVSGPIPSALGGIVTLTVTGDTGTIGANGLLAISPASDPNWRANSYQLISVRVVLSGGNTGPYNNQLYISGLNKENTSYTIVYSFIAVDTTTTPTTVSPVNYIGSGTQIKHTDITTTSANAAFPPIQPASNTASISSKTANPTNLPIGGVVDYTITLSNSSQNSAVVLDDIVDTLPANTSYVAGSAKFNGVLISNPSISGQTLTFRQLFSVPAANLTTGANGTSTLTYQVSLPNVSGNYTNQVVGHIGNSILIDTTLDITDNVPATASVTVGTPPFSISGKIFEDPNYGGGSGRPLSTPTTSVRQNARVELYDAAGIFKAFALTNISGLYKFDATNVTGGIVAGNYYIRVVNITVTSSRGTGSNLIPVQTFRVDNKTGTPANAPNQVGGENPFKVDGGAAAIGAKLAITNFIFVTGAGSAVAGDQAESVSTVKVGAITDITGIDFGFNFDTIVNTNDTGQGSLRQFIINSSALGGEASLAQAGKRKDKLNVDQSLPTGVETSIFMIPSSTDPLGRTKDPGYDITRGVAQIIPLTLLPTITGTNANSSSIDGTTQTVNIGNNNAGALGRGGTVGVDKLKLDQVQRPEIEIFGNNQFNGINDRGLIASGVSDFTVRGLAAYNFYISIEANNTIRPTVEQNILGSKADVWADPGSNRDIHKNLFFNTGTQNGIAQNNLLGFTTNNDALTFTGTTNSTITNNDCQAGAVGTNSVGDCYTLYDNNSNNTIRGNLATNISANGIDILRGSNNNLVENNTITNAGTGNQETAGIRITDYYPAPLLPSSNNTLKRNIISGSVGSGILITSGTGNTISENSLYGNGALGIDLLKSTEINSRDTGIAPYITANDGTTDINDSNSSIDYPVITLAKLDSIAATIQIAGFVGKLPSNTTFGNAKIEFFIADNTPANQNGEVILNDGKSKPHGEGRTYLGSCVTNSNSQFNCTIPAATLSIANNITATATDSNGNTSEFSANPSSRASLVLAKRITQITSADTKFTTSYTSIFINDTGWPSNYLAGLIDAGQVRPGDTIEYTIYYLNNGENRIGQARICDGLNNNLDFVFDFNSTNIGKGILFSPSSGPAKYLTNAYAANDDQGQYSTTSPADCNLVNNTTADRSTNTVVVDAANSSNPILGGAYGSIKFKAKVK